MAMTAIVPLNETLPVVSPLMRTSRNSSGRASWRNSSTAAVMRPSIRPMARWIGCMMAQNAPNGRSVMPESVVSSTTENAPSCSVSTQPSTDASVILRRFAARSPRRAKQRLRISGR